MDLNHILKQFGRDLDRNSPTILTGLAVTGLLATVIMAVKATPKALELIEKEKTFREEEFGDGRDLDAMSTIEATWKVYVPAAGMGVLTIACMIGANHISLQRNAAVVSLLSITRTAIAEYQEKVIETVGEKKEELMRGEIAQDHLVKNPYDEKTVVLTGHGQYLCFDEFSGRYFRSDIETINQAVNKFNQELLREGWLSVNELYDRMGLEPVKYGDLQGWIAQYAIVELRTSSKTEPKTKEPCLVIDFIVQPRDI